MSPYAILHYKFLQGGIEVVSPMSSFSKVLQEEVECKPIFFNFLSDMGCLDFICSCNKRDIEHNESIITYVWVKSQTHQN